MASRSSPRGEGGHGKTEDAIAVQCFIAGSCPSALKRKIASDLAEGMPSFGVSAYFETKASLFDGQANTILVNHRPSGMVIGLLVAAYLENLERETLYIRTILIAEPWHTKNISNLLLRYMFNSILSNGRRFPETITFKTYSPKSFRAMAAFARIPGVDMYPALSQLSPPRLITHVRAISDLLAPGHVLDEATGVLFGASDGVNEFYADLPASGHREIDDHFKKFVTPSDRLLCCLFIEGQSAASRILRAVGSQSLRA